MIKTFAPNWKRGAGLRRTLCWKRHSKTGARFVFRCGAVALPAETSRPVGARLWLYANFDCNLRCDYCSVRSSPAAPRRELGLGRVQRIAREAAELGVKEIFVTGGEPFLLDDIGEILRTCAVAAPTTVLTNGMLFAGRRLRPTELYPAIASFYKSAWIARRQTATTCIAGPEPGSEHTKASNALVEKDFECGWRQRFRAMPRLRSSVTSVRSANMPRVSPPGAAAIFHVGDGVSPRS